MWDFGMLVPIFAIHGLKAIGEEVTLLATSSRAWKQFYCLNQARESIVMLGLNYCILTMLAS